MDTIIPIDVRRATGKVAQALRAAGNSSRAEPSTAVDTDVIEVLNVTRPDHSPEAEHMRLLDLRRQIAAGSYLTPDKLEVVTERLFALLGSGFHGHGRRTA